MRGEATRHESACICSAQRLELSEDAHEQDAQQAFEPDCAVNHVKGLSRWHRKAAGQGAAHLCSADCDHPVCTALGTCFWPLQVRAFCDSGRDLEQLTRDLAARSLVDSADPRGGRLCVPTRRKYTPRRSRSDYHRAAAATAVCVALRSAGTRSRSALSFFRP